LVRVILVRHGETEWNRLHQIQGSNSDISLNKTGRQQVENLALRLKKEPIQAFYSSPLERALDTARAIARYHRLEINPEPDLRELDLGELEGTKIEDLNQSYREILFITREGETLPRVAGGESLREVQQRAWNTVQRIVSRHTEGAIVIVSHYFALLTIICQGLNLPLLEMGRIRLDAASMSILAFDGKFPRLLLLNDTCHI